MGGKKNPNNKKKKKQKPTTNECFGQPQSQIVKLELIILGIRKSLERGGALWPGAM